jgi:hypothetical protein
MSASKGQYYGGAYTAIPSGDIRTIRLTSDGKIMVETSSATASNAAVYDATPPTIVDGASTTLFTDVNGNLKGVEQYQPVYEDNTAGVAKVEHRYSYTRISTATTTVIKASAGFLHKIIWNKSVATGITTVYDNTSAAGTIVAIRTVGAALLSDPPLSGEYNCTMGTGITVVTSQAEDITVVWR